MALAMVYAVQVRFFTVLGGSVSANPWQPINLQDHGYGVQIRRASDSASTIRAGRAHSGRRQLAVAAYGEVVQAQTFGLGVVRADHPLAWVPFGRCGPIACRMDPISIFMVKDKALTFRHRPRCG